MELQKFIETAIMEIVKGVESARLKIEEEKIDTLINPTTNNAGHVRNYNSSTDSNHRNFQNIEFNVAVTTQSENGANGGLKVSTGIFSLGVDGNVSTSESAVNNIKFIIPISLPFEKKVEKNIH